MVSPNYRISLGKQELVEQPDSDLLYQFGTIKDYIEETLEAITSYIDFGKTTGVDSVGIYFATGYLNRSFIAVLPQIEKVGNPTDQVRMKLYHTAGVSYGDPIDDAVLIATSENLYQDLLSPRRTYYFDRVALEKSPGNSYFWAVERTGDKDDSNYWRICRSDFDGTVWGITVTYESGVWTLNLETDPEINFAQAYDIGDRYLFGMVTKYVGVQDFIRVSSVSFYGTQHGPDVQSLRCGIYLGDSPYTLIDLSVSQITEDGKLTFYFPDSILEKDVWYVVACYSDCIDDPWTPISSDSYWEAEYLYGSIGSISAGYFGSDNELYARMATGYIHDIEGDNLCYDSTAYQYSVPRFKLQYTKDINALDLTGETEDGPVDDVVNVTINTGKNDVDGAIIEGSCDIALRNDNGRYNPNNPDSDLYSEFKIFAWLNVFGFYENVGGPLFTGPIKKITPNMRVGLQPTNVYAGDLFYRIKNTTISLGELSGKTASELIEIVLTAMGLTPDNWDIDTSDTTVLATITWNEVTAISCLNMIVEAGQHHHFINGSGVYVFRTNQWLASGIEKYSFDETNASSPKLEWDIEAVYNKVIMMYNEVPYELNDITSQELYDIREITIDNVLMPSAAYALFVARYILDTYSYPGKRLEFTLENLYPEILDIYPGDVVQFSNASINVDARYIVLGLTRSFDTSKNHTLILKCREWQQPPVTDLQIYSPVTGDSWRYFDSEATQGSQGFVLPIDFIPSSVSFTLKHSLDATTPIYAYIYASDGAGLPTGSPVATSSPVTIPYGDTNDTYTFYFPTISQTEFDAATTFCFVIDLPKSAEFMQPFIYPNNIINFGTTAVDFKAFGQSFTVAEDKDLYGITIAPSWNCLETQNFGTYIELYEADVNGHPNVLVETSRVLNLSGSGVSVKKTYSFAPPPTLDHTKLYCWKLCETWPSDSQVPFNINYTYNRFAGGFNQYPSYAHYSRCGQVFENTRKIVNPKFLLMGQWTGPDTPIFMSLYDVVDHAPDSIIDAGSEIILNELTHRYSLKFTETLAAATEYAIVFGVFPYNLYSQFFHAWGYPGNILPSGNMFIEVNGVEWVDQVSWDMYLVIIAEKYENRWGCRGRTDAAYANGLAWKQLSSDDSYVNLTAGTDFWFALRTTPECRWSAWGQSINPRVTLGNILVSQFITDWENELCPPILDDCEIANWIEDARSVPETLNSEDLVNGVYSLNLGKDNHGGTAFQFGYYKAITPANPNLYNAGIWLKIKAAAMAVMRNSPVLFALQIVLYTSGGNYYRKSYLFSQLGATDQWVRYGADFPSGWISVGSPNPEVITALQIIMWTTNITDTITIGDIIMDYWHYFNDYNACGLEYELKYY